jgi:hypothetical protein
MDDGLFWSIGCERTEGSITDDIAGHESWVEVVFIGTPVFVGGVKNSLNGSFLCFFRHLLV